jgi:hypothetical protein
MEALRAPMNESTVRAERPFGVDGGALVFNIFNITSGPRSARNARHMNKPHVLVHSLRSHLDGSANGSRMASLSNRNQYLPPSPLLSDGSQSICIVLVSFLVTEPTSHIRGRLSRNNRTRSPIL